MNAILFLLSLLAVFYGGLLLTFLVMFFIDREVFDDTLEEIKNDFRFN